MHTITEVVITMRLMVTLYDKKKYSWQCRPSVMMFLMASFQLRTPLLSVNDMNLSRSLM